MANPLLRDPAAWINGKPIAQSELSALDVALAQPINGDGGGTYTQGAGNTTIAGSGLWLAASTAHQLANGALALTPSDKAVTHADDDYTTLALSHIGGFRQVATACARAGTVGGWTRDPYSRVSLMSTRLGAEMVLPLRVLDGARLGYAELHFFVSSGHAMTPGTPIRCRILRIDAAGATTPLTTNSADGFVAFTAAVGTGGSFDASVLRTLTVFCDTANVIDVSTYSYAAHSIEEAGQYGIAGNIFADVNCAHYDIHDLRPQ
jgi:hypothetical protein